MSSRCMAIQSMSVTDLAAVLDGLSCCGLLKDSYSPSNKASSSTNDDNAYILFSLVEQSKEFVKLGILSRSSGEIIGHLLIIRSEIIVKNSPVFIYVDDISKFSAYIQKLESSSRGDDIDVERFRGKVGTMNKMLLYFEIVSHCNICILETARDGSDITLITEWSLSRRCSRSISSQTLLSSKNNGHSPTREEVEEEAWKWHEGVSNPQSSTGDDSNDVSKGTFDEDFAPPASASTKVGGVGGSYKKIETDPNLMTDEEFSRFYGRQLPQLYLSILNRDNKHREFTCNSPLPVPFANELFDGKLLLMINTAHKTLKDSEYSSIGPDLYDSRFEGTKYTFDIQVQGKFVKAPSGHIYFGAESSVKMDLNWASKLLAEQVIAFAKGFNQYVHGSIGSDDEVPHTTAPLWSTLDALIVTPGKKTDRSIFKNQVTFSEKPPSLLGSPLNEDPDLRAARRKNHKFQIPIDLDTTYTFSFMSTQLEVIAWNIIVLGRCFKLSTFFGSADIRMACYSVEYGTPEDNAGELNGHFLPTKHLQSKITYMFNLKIQHILNHPEFIEQNKISVGLDHIPQKIDENNSSGDSYDTASKDNSDDEDNFVDIPVYVEDDSASYRTPKSGGGSSSAGGGSAVSRRQSSRRSLNLTKEDFERDMKQYYGRRIPNLYLKLKSAGRGGGGGGIGGISDDRYESITANSPAPIPFCNEYVEGRVLFMINTNHKSNRQENASKERTPDLYESRFEGTKFTYDIQVQAKFLKKPRGHIFMGFETTKKMSLGKLTSTNAFYNRLISLGRRFNPNLHWSFGDEKNMELPHVVAPLWHAVDTLIITPGEGTDVSQFTNVTLSNTLPAFGGIFVEDPRMRLIRRQDFNFRVPIDLDAIYSCSFKSTQLELISWKWNNVPVFGNFDLHSFFDDADLRFCCYCVPYDGDQKENWGEEDDSGNRVISVLDNKILPKYHIQDKLIQLLSIEVQHKSNHPEYKHPPVGEEKSPPLLNIKHKKP